VESSRKPRIPQAPCGLLASAHGDSDAEKDSRHALRVLDYYDSLQDAASRCFLQLLGLFDRPMNVQ
jgi:hypothetical protein